MKPVLQNKNYVGVEIEGLFNCDKQTLLKKLHKHKSLVGITDVTTDGSIRDFEKSLYKINILNSEINRVWDKYKRLDTHGYYIMGCVTFKVNIKILKNNKYVKHDNVELSINISNRINSKFYLKVTLNNSCDTAIELEQYRVKKSFPLEVRIIAQQTKLIGILKKVYSVLEKCDFKINKSCGLHVHLDMRNRNASKSYTNLFHSLGLLFKLNPTRRRNFYCKRNKYDQLHNEQYFSRYKRYRAINTLSLDRHQTLEVRLGEATTDVNRVINFAKLLVKIVDIKKLDKPIEKTDTSSIDKYIKNIA